MKVRLICFIVMICLTTAIPAYASSTNEGSLPEEMFTQALTAFSYMGSGDYASAIKTLGLSNVKADDFKLFAASGLPSISKGVQTEFALAVHSNTYGWLIALPIWAPDSLDVETLLLHSSDSKTFDSYSATTWAFVEKLIQDSVEIIRYNSKSESGKYLVPDA